MRKRVVKEELSATKVDALDAVLGPMPEIITMQSNPVEELLKVKLQLLEGKLELLTNRVDAFENGFKENVIEILDKHVEQKFKEEQDANSEDPGILSDKAEIKLHGIYHSEDTGVRIELDWNDPFISYLRTKGLPGADDEQVVKHWLASMLRDIENSIDGKKKVSDSEFG